MSPSHDYAPDDTRGAGAAPRAVFRIPATGYAAVLCLTAILLVPVVGWPAYWGWLLVIPVFLVWWVARMRTVVTPQGLAVRTTTGSRTEGWDTVRGIVFPHPRVFGISWARAHLRDGGVLRLPAVGWNDIPRFAAASGGHVPDPIVLRSESADGARGERITEDPE